MTLTPEQINRNAAAGAGNNDAQLRAFISLLISLLSGPIKNYTHFSPLPSQRKITVECTL
jgi:uncharacterized protein YraI